MYPRINYEMTQADLDAIREACKPIPVMFLSGGTPMGGSPQERANAAWQALGRKMGFDHMSVRPIDGKGILHFTAVPTENETQRTERLARESEEKRLAEIKQLESVIADAQEKLKAIGGAK